MITGAISTVFSNVPENPRTASCVFAVAPSSDIDIALPPASRNDWMRSGVSFGVTDGDNETLRPFEVPYSVSSSRSARSNGSPPVNTTSGNGFPYDDSASSSRLPSSVVS